MLESKDAVDETEIPTMAARPERVERPGAGSFSRDRDRDQSRGRPPRESGREPSRDRGAPPAGKGAPRAKSTPSHTVARLWVGAGRKDKMRPGDLVGAIANEAGLNGRSIGRIQIFDTHSTVDLPSGMPDEVFQGLRRLRVMNKELQISRLNA
jgi:ATP-dependent RNA helicase DeaD